MQSLHVVGFIEVQLEIREFSALPMPCVNATLSASSRLIGQARPHRTCIMTCTYESDGFDVMNFSSLSQFMV